MSEIKSKDIELVDIESIVPNPKNANRHSIEQIKRLEKLITYQGFRNPLIVSNRTGFLIVGHGRLEAAKNLGIEQLPVIRQDFTDEAQEYAYLISDNEIARWAELDMHSVYTELKDLELPDVELLGLEAFSLDVEVLDPKTDEDAVPDVVDPITVRGDVWLLGRHRLMCGDSTMIDDVEKLTQKKEIDFLYTDPPYGISIVQNNQIGGGGSFGVGKEAKKGGKDITATQYAPVIGDDSIDIAIESIQIINILNPNIQIIWGGNYYANHLENSNCWIVWDKETGTNTFADAELAWSNQDTKVRIFKHQWMGLCKASEHGQKRVHPTQKPIALADWCIEHYADKSENILDLFGGSGSTLISAEKNNLDCMMMEMSESYCDVIINRWQNYTGKKATLETTSQTYEELCNERK